MKIAEGIHLVPGIVGTRPLQLFLLAGARLRVLVDTGCAPDPELMIFPYLRTMGFGPEDVDLVINTHCDMDHCGGNHAVKCANPKVRIICGEADRKLVEDPAIMWAQRYNAYAQRHGIRYDHATRLSFFEAMGKAQPVDHTWRGGETLDLGDGWHVEIHHVPGHSQGHLAVFDPRSRTLLSGDAVQGAQYPDAFGLPALCPTYLDVDRYVETIHAIGSMPVECLATCHWPVMRGHQVPAFLAESLKFVERADRMILSLLVSTNQEWTLADIIAHLGQKLGSWPETMDGELVYALAGHMDSLIARKLLVEVSETTPVRFRLAEDGAASGVLQAQAARS